MLAVSCPFLEFVRIRFVAINASCLLQFSVAANVIGCLYPFYSCICRDCGFIMFGNETLSRSGGMLGNPVNHVDVAQLVE